uniref:Elongation factor 1-beta (inferred by orthology to a human protein) n=1 Tax=Strongyloides venezuelensis TaxID=75913 RepID=A0A0K0FXV3_STRVS
MTFSKDVINATSAADLAAFNAYLGDFPYAGGYTVSLKDFALFKLFKTAPCSKAYEHLSRWYKNVASFTEEEQKSFGGPSTSSANKADDEDFDLFDSEEEDDEQAKIVQERLKAYNEKKSKKPGPIAKSNIIYDVKPWDDSIKISEIEEGIRKIEKDGLVWGAAKVLPVAFGIQKLQICCVVEDDKVSSDWLEEQITDMEDLVQSVDVVAFNKV